MNALAIPEELASWVSGIERAAAVGDTAVDPPDHATTLVIRSVPGGRSAMVVMGPRTRATYHVAEPGHACLRIRLRPGRARALLERPPRELVDRVVPLDRIRGFDADRIARDPIHSLSVMLEGLTAGQTVHAAAIALAAGEDVATAAARSRVGERRLRTLFDAGIGLSPKHFARIDRVRAVLDSGRGRSWADVAVAAGYYDQSHMTAEFRRLMGVPPAAFFAGRHPAPRRCGRPSAT